MASEPLPRRRVRRPVAPLQPVVRPEPTLVPRLRRPARDPRLPRGLLRPVRRAPQGPAVHRGGRGPLGRRRRRAGASAIGTAACTRRRSWCRRSACSTRRRSPTSRASTSSTGTVVPLGPLGPRPRPRRPAGGGDRHRRQRHPGRARHRRPDRPPRPVPAHRARGSCRAQDEPYTPEQQRQFAQDPHDRRRSPPAAARHVRRDHRVPLRRPDRPRAWRRSRRGYLERKVADPGLRARLTPRHPFGCTRTLVSSDYYPAVQRDRRRPGHDGHRARHGRRDPHRRRRGTAGRHHRAVHRVPRRRLPARHRGRRPRGRRASTTGGAACPGPTTASPCPASRTSSCCTGRTPTRAATRSS